MFAAGFAEARDGDAAGARSAAAADGLPVCGPNGNGIVSLPDRVALWGDTIAPREPGPVALISQSGNVAVNALASRRGLRLHTVVSCGNQAVLDAADFLDALAERDGVRSVALYLEADGDGAALVRGAGALRAARASASRCSRPARRARAPRPPPPTRARWPATSASFRALFEECGAAWAEDPHDLLELAKALRRARAARARRAAARRRGGHDLLGRRLGGRGRPRRASSASTLPALAPGDGRAARGASCPPRRPPATRSTTRRCCGTTPRRCAS